MMCYFHGTYHLQNRVIWIAHWGVIISWHSWYAPTGLSSLSLPISQWTGTRPTAFAIFGSTVAGTKLKPISLRAKLLPSRGRYFDMHLREKKIVYFYKFQLKFVPEGRPIDNNPKLVQIMAWHRIGDKPLSEPMLTRFTDAYMRHQVEASFNINIWHYLYRNWHYKEKTV